MFRSYTETIRTSREKTPTSSTLQSYACDLCDDNYWHSETDVELHRKDVHLPIIREQLLNHSDRFCTVCMTLHATQSDLLSHVKTNHLLSSPNARRVEREIFICDHCNCILFNKGMLETHMMYLHLWTPPKRIHKSFSCPKCKKVIKLKSIWFHLQLHEIPSLSVCEICLTHCRNIRELYCHMKSHSMYYKCEICDYQTTKEQHYDAHLEKHSNSQIQIKSSAKLGKMVKIAFSRQSAQYPVIKYNMHHTLKGLELPRCLRICTLCREICTNRAEMKAHMGRDHALHAPPRRSSRCACGAEFFNRVLLKQHLFKTGNTLLHRELADNEKPMKNVNKQTMIEIEISNIGPIIPCHQTTKKETNPDTGLLVERRKEILTEQGILTKIGTVSKTETIDNPEETIETDHEETLDFENEETLDLENEETLETYSEETLDLQNEERLETYPEETLELENEETLDIVSGETQMRKVKREIVEKRTEIMEIEIDNGEVVDPDMETGNDEMTYIYAEIDDGELVTIASQSNEQVLGF